MATAGLVVVLFVLWVWGRIDEKWAAEAALLEDAHVGLVDDDDLQVENLATTESESRYRAVEDV
jgi:hypothetical protein